MAIRIRSWVGGKVLESTDIDDVARIVAAKGSVTWIDLTAPSAELVAALGRRLGLHPLVLEDILEKNERPKIEHFDDVLHLVAFVLERTGAADLAAEEVDFLVGRDFVVSVHGAAWDPFEVRHLRLGVGSLLEHGPDRLLWALVDSIVDGYFPVFDTLSDEIEATQDLVLGKADPATLQTVFGLRRDLIRMRHVLAPTREAFAQLSSHEFPQVSEASVLFFRDVYDHLIRLNEELDTHRELLSGTLEVYLSTVNNNLAAIMKRLTGVTVILAGIGAVGGLFGMSEATGAISGAVGPGFYAIVVATVVGAVLAVVALRRINWL